MMHWQATVVLSSFALLACATEVNSSGAGGSGGDVPSTGGSGGSGGTSTGGASTGGASVGGGGNAEGGGGGTACAQNCATIQVPDCFQAICNEATGTCDVGPAPDDTPCEDGAFCTDGDTCQGGVCQAGGPLDCTGGMPAPCQQSTCDEDADECLASPLPNGSPCSLTDLCQLNPICQNGACLGAAIDCSAFSSPCGLGLCEPTTGACYAMPLNDGDPCNDGSSCTIGDECNGGTCAGTPDPTYTVYFTEDFSDNSAGWTLGTEWAIGPAMASPPATGNGDPAMDHSGSSDNGVAGVAIGGNCSTALHGFYYLESPVINTAGAPGSVWLEFWRWLNSDYTPFMQNQIEVYNGTSWVVLWQSGSLFITDNAWVKISHDLTAYKNANMRVRIGFNVGSSGVFTIGGWNVDDLTIASAPCN